MQVAHTHWIVTTSVALQFKTWQKFEIFTEIGILGTWNTLTRHTGYLAKYVRETQRRYLRGGNICEAALLAAQLK